MKTIVVTFLFLLNLEGFGQNENQITLNTKIVIKIVQQNLTKIDKFTKVLFVNGPVNTNQILDSLHHVFPIIVTKEYQTELKHLKDKMNCLNVTVYSSDNAYIEFQNVEYDPNTGSIIFTQTNSTVNYNYKESEDRIIEIK